MQPRLLFRFLQEVTPVPRTVSIPKRILARFTEYAGLRSQREMLQKREDEIKKELNAAVEELGWKDDQDHEYLNFPEPIAGYEGLKRTCRKYPTLNVEAAEKILRKKGLYEQCTREVIELDEDLIRAAHFEGQLTQKDIDNMFSWRINYAFTPEKSMPTRLEE